MSRLDNAIKLATETHSGQTDLGGYPYILHPLRVLCAVEKHIRDMKVSDRDSILCSAVLHDVIEDSKQGRDQARYEVSEVARDDFITFEGINYGEVVEKTVDTLSRGKDEPWNKYINKINEHWAPRIIKIYDLKDNLDLSRIKDISDKDLKRNSMYEKALKKLQETEESHAYRI